MSVKLFSSPEKRTQKNAPRKTQIKLQSRDGIDLLCPNHRKNIKTANRQGLVIVCNCLFTPLLPHGKNCEPKAPIAHGKSPSPAPFRLAAQIPRVSSTFALEGEPRKAAYIDRG